LGAVDELDQVVRLGLRVWLQYRELRVVPQLLWQLLQQACQSVAQLLQVLEPVGAAAGATGVLNFLLASHDLKHGARQRAARAPKVDLKGEGVATRIALEHPLKGRVRHQPTVPVELALDLDRWKTRWQSAARHHMLGTDAVSRVVEVQEVTGGHVRGADAEACLAGIDAIEVDQAFECGLERRRIVVARSLYAAGGLKPDARHSGRKKAGSSAEERGSGA